MVKNISIDNMPLDGGTLCLDFVNTVHHRKKTPLEDYFHEFGDLLYWAKKVGIVDHGSYRIMAIESAKRKTTARLFFVKAIELRELVFRIFLNIASRQPIDTGDLEAFNNYAAAYFASIRLIRKGSRVVENLALDAGDFNSITVPVLKSAYELLISDKLERVKECPNCGWLFLDSTKNGKRRWCSMKSCGSGVKALEYYYRKKEGIY